MSAITREEIERATEVLLRDGIYDLHNATKDTSLLAALVASSHAGVPRFESVVASYHHGIRIGMEIQLQRDKLAHAQQVETGSEASAEKV